MHEEDQKGQPRIDPDDMFDFFCSLAIMRQLGETDRLAKIKGDYPVEYADWERRQAKIDAEKAKGQTKQEQ